MWDFDKKKMCGVKPHIGIGTMKKMWNLICGKFTAGRNYNLTLNIEKAYNKEHAENKIPHLSAHVLRHTGCTLFASAGMELKVLQDLMGHADAQVTLNVYNHKSQERTAREMQRIDNEINL